MALHVHAFLRYRKSDLFYVRPDVAKRLAADRTMIVNELSEREDTLAQRQIPMATFTLRKRLRGMQHLGNAFEFAVLPFIDVDVIVLLRTFGIW